MITPAEREELRRLRRATNDARRALEDRVVVYRNGVLCAVLILTAVLVVVPSVIAGTATDLAVLRPTGGDARPLSAVDVASVELWGMIGGVIGALVSLRRLQPSAQAVGLKLVQLVLKLPAGAATALFGVVLLQAGIVPPLSPVEPSKIAAYAVLFGFAQEALTSVVDRQAGRLLNRARTVDDRAARAA